VLVCVEGFQRCGSNFTPFKNAYGWKEISIRSSRLSRLNGANETARGEKGGVMEEGLVCGPTRVEVEGCFEMMKEVGDEQVDEERDERFCTSPRGVGEMRDL